jgi:predicted Fe-Mo cluster-binding NifX family protein
MKVGFAVQGNEGVESKVYDHFGSAPAFVIVDTEGKEVSTVNNRDLHHVHGACNPIMALDGKSVEAMVVGGIGAGAITKLNAMGVKVCPPLLQVKTSIIRWTSSRAFCLQCVSPIRWMRTLTAT